MGQGRWQLALRQLLIPKCGHWPTGHWRSATGPRGIAPDTVDRDLEIIPTYYLATRAVLPR